MLQMQTLESKNERCGLCISYKSITFILYEIYDSKTVCA